MSWIKPENICGYCKYHKKIMSKKQVKRKGCLHKKEEVCKHFNKRREKKNGCSRKNKRKY